MALEGCDTPECLQARSFPRTTIPPVARARREMLTTTAAAGRAPRFVQRTTPLQGATCSQTLGCGLLGHPQAPLEALPHTAAAVGIEIRPHALEQRLTAAAAACLPQGRLAALARGITAAPGAMPLLERLTAVSGPESATSIVPALFAAPWPGGGGSTAARARAALQLQARWEMWTGRLDGPRQEGRASERAAVLPGPLPAGAVRLAAVGSWSLEAVAALEPPQVCWRSRLQRQTAVDEATGERRARRDRWESQALAMGALAVALGERQRLAARLLAVRVPPDGAATRLAALAGGGPRPRAPGPCHPAGGGRRDARRDAGACRALDGAGGFGARAPAVAEGAALHVVDESGPRGRVAQHHTLAPAGGGVCDTPRDVPPTWGRLGPLVGLSRPQRDSSRADRAAPGAAPGERVSLCPAPGASASDGQARPRCGVSDASAAKASQHFSTLTAGNRAMTRVLA